MFGNPQIHRRLRGGLAAWQDAGATLTIPKPFWRNSVLKARCILWVIRYRQILMFLHFLMKRTEQPQSPSISATWSRQPYSSCTSLLLISDWDISGWGSAGYGSALFCLALELKTVLHSLCWNFPVVLFHALYKILLSAATFMLLCIGVFGPSLGVRIVLTQPHICFLK